MTPELLKACTGSLLAQRCADLAPFFTNTMAEYHIDATPVRQAMFLAQVGHESEGLRYMREIWGPTPNQKRYEPPSDLARQLGNTQPGDGRRFAGRGPIQITGRFNYAKFSKILGVDLIAHPELLEGFELAVRSAGAFWDDRGLNALADADDFLTITKRINGGTNGLADRQARLAGAKIALGIT